ncbi:hypothetical protein M434DRAFT_122049 [Hypoxylon sp. CO27-5]|nr:hypothetical protein M434DRAFT_122049 [Hypoxylon sp. CO27-5]
MKTSAILVGVGAALAVAQDISFPQGFPDCGVTCIRNMLGQAAQLGCSDVAPSCLCTKQNFIYGVRDCATESCPDNASAQQVIQYGSQYCASVGVAVSGLPSATGQNPSASTTVVATASPTTASASQESGHATGSGSIPISTATFETTVTHSGSAVASTVTSTAFSASGVSASGTGVSGNVSGSVTTGVVASSITTNGSTLVTSVTTTGPASSHASEASSEASGTGSSTHAGSESTSSSSNPAQRTAAPAGFIAAAGLAALML